MYRITYVSIQSGLREIYLNNTGFSAKEADEEIARLEKQQADYEKAHYPKTRSDFKKEEIKVRN